MRFGPCGCRCEPGDGTICFTFTDECTGAGVPSIPVYRYAHGSDTILEFLGSGSDGKVCFTSPAGTYDFKYGGRDADWNPVFIPIGTYTLPGAADVAITIANSPLKTGNVNISDEFGPYSCQVTLQGQSYYGYATGFPGLVGGGLNRVYVEDILGIYNTDGPYYIDLGDPCVPGNNYLLTIVLSPPDDGGGDGE